MKWRRSGAMRSSPASWPGSRSVCESATFTRMGTCDRECMHFRFFLTGSTGDHLCNHWRPYVAQKVKARLASELLTSRLTADRQQSFPAQIWNWYSATGTRTECGEQIDAAYGLTSGNSKVKPNCARPQCEAPHRWILPKFRGLRRCRACHTGFSAWGRPQKLCHRRNSQA